MVAVIDKSRIEVITISVYQVVGDTFLGKETDGDIIFECIKKALYANQKVILSFLNIQTITTVFLYSAIGKLYKCFNRDFIKDNLLVADIDNIDLQLLKRVVDTAKAFYPVRLDCRKKGKYQKRFK